MHAYHPQLALYTKQLCAQDSINQKKNQRLAYTSKRMQWPNEMSFGWNGISNRGRANQMIIWAPNTQQKQNKPHTRKYKTWIVCKLFVVRPEIDWQPFEVHQSALFCVNVLSLTKFYEEKTSIHCLGRIASWKKKTMQHDEWLYTSEKARPLSRSHFGAPFSWLWSLWSLVWSELSKATKSQPKCDRKRRRKKEVRKKQERQREREKEWGSEVNVNVYERA